MPKTITAILARCVSNGGIGFDSKIPWSLQHDMNFFKQMTLGPLGGKTSAVIMGRKTFASIGSKPLAHRMNILLSTTLTEAPENVHLYTSFEDALAYANRDPTIKNIFVIGGASLYRTAFEHKDCKDVFITHVHSTFTCDTFCDLPDPTTWFVTKETKTFEEKGVSYHFAHYKKMEQDREDEEDEEDLNFHEVVKQTRYDEYEYLNLIHSILIQDKKKRIDRTFVGTFSQFGYQCRYDLQKGFPLFTTKKTFWRGIVTELLWMISGCTDSKELEKDGIKIWKGNGSRDFLDLNGFSEREVGDLGPIYGFQWRHAGADYSSSSVSYEGKGIDQLQNVINELKNNPTSRRIILNAWGVKDLPSMALPPCHILCQFYVDMSDMSLSCHMYQRSADLGLGVPFNVASYSLLTHIIAHLTGYQVGHFIHSIGDAHIYANHTHALQKQLTRKVKKPPTLFINDLEGEIKSIDDVREKHILLLNYKSHSSIRMQMAV